MSFKRNLGMAVLVILGFVLMISIARAEQPLDLTYCFSLVSTVVSENEEMKVTSFDFKGIARTNLPDKAFDNLTFHGVGVGRLAAGKNHNYGYIKFMDPDGDYVVTENLRDLGDTEGTWKFLQGTPTRCINILRAIMKTAIRIAFQGNYESATGDHPWRPSTFVIPGLTRNPGFLSGFPLSRE